jgi:hypothetical protein
MVRLAIVGGGGGGLELEKRVIHGIEGEGAPARVPRI